MGTRVKSRIDPGMYLSWHVRYNLKSGMGIGMKNGQKLAEMYFKYLLFKYAVQCSP